MRVVGVVCIAVALAFIIGLRFTGRSERAAAAWTPYNKVMAGFAGVVAIIAGSLLLVGGVE